MDQPIGVRPRSGPDIARPSVASPRCSDRGCTASWSAMASTLHWCSKSYPPALCTTISTPPKCSWTSETVLLTPSSVLMSAWMNNSAQSVNLRHSSVSSCCLALGGLVAYSESRPCPTGKVNPCRQSHQNASRSFVMPPRWHRPARIRRAKSADPRDHPTVVLTFLYGEAPRWDSRRGAHPASS
jgi:hypothetical protein